MESLFEDFISDLSTMISLPGLWFNLALNNVELHSIISRTPTDKFKFGSECFIIGLRLSFFGWWTIEPSSLIELLALCSVLDLCGLQSILSLSWDSSAIASNSFSSLSFYDLK